MFFCSLGFAQIKESGHNFECMKCHILTKFDKKFCLACHDGSIAQFNHHTKWCKADCKECHDVHNFDGELKRKKNIDCLKCHKK